MTYNEFRILKQQMDRIEGKIDTMATNTGTGLSALQQADADLAQAITDNTTATQQAAQEISTLLSEAGEDATVGSIAADVEAKIALIKANSAALAAAVPAPPAASTPGQSPAGS